MVLLKLFLLYCYQQAVFCGWVSDWMVPIQEQFKENVDVFPLNEEETRIISDDAEPLESHLGEMTRYDQYNLENDKFADDSLKEKLEETLQNARASVETLKSLIIRTTNREKILKEAIANGISGTTTAKVTMMSGMTKAYIIHDGVWMLCNGIIQNGVTKMHQHVAPMCLGGEIFSRRDPCVFNSVIKYETISNRRKAEYTEDNYLCLKPSFNNTLEQYFSVPRHIINETCDKGVVRSTSDNMQRCGIRILVEYTYYPHKGLSADDLPFEYCVQSKGICKLITAWQISNKTISNTEFLKDEPKFKSNFIKSYYPY